jgi:hypothetical protein
MVRVNQLPGAKEIKMRARKFSEINSTFQKNFKILVDYYGLSFNRIAYDQDMEERHVRDLYGGLYGTLSPFIILDIASYFGSTYYDITHNEIVIINGDLYYS